MNIINRIDLPTYLNKQDFFSTVDCVSKRFDIVDVKISNGMSIVLICNNRLSNTLTVFQYFISKATLSRIKNLFDIINSSKHIRLPDSRYIFKYKATDFLVPYISSSNNLINWKYVLPLNDIPTESLKNIITDNIQKLVWDIGLALYSLYALGISHRDARIDNIGLDLVRKCFVLFDFDGSVTDFSSQYSDDIEDFVNSIDYTVNQLSLSLPYNYKKIWNMPYSFCLNVNMVHDYVLHNQDKNVSYIMALDYFDALPLKYE